MPVDHVPCSLLPSLIIVCRLWGAMTDDGATNREVQKEDIEARGPMVIVVMVCPRTIQHELNHLLYVC